MTIREQTRKRRASLQPQNAAAAAPALELTLPDNATLEISDTLNTILDGIKHHKADVVRELADVILPKGFGDTMTDEDLRDFLKSETLNLPPQKLNEVDAALRQLELNVIRKRRR